MHPSSSTATTPSGIASNVLFAVPVKSWQVVGQDLVRVTRPGGWVELVEGATEVAPAGPATERLNQLLQRLSRTRGLDSTGIVSRSLDGYLTRAGIVNVEKRTVPLPMGEWGGRIGSLMATDNRALFMRLAPVFEAGPGAWDVSSAPTSPSAGRYAALAVSAACIGNRTAGGCRSVGS